jgi:hypothetical protein
MVFKNIVQNPTYIKLKQNLIFVKSEVIKMQRIYDIILDLMYMGEINIHAALEIIRAVKYEEQKISKKVI